MVVRYFSCDTFIHRQKMKIKNNLLLSLIPFLCLISAIALLYAKPHILKHVYHPLDIPVLEGKAALLPEITIHYHERPPYYVTGPLGVYGLCCDPVKKAFDAAGIPFKWVKTPAGRQLDILKFNGKNECIIGWFKNPDREKFAVFSHYIYQDKPTIALARADNHRILPDRPLEETLKNPGLILLKKHGYSYGEYVDDLISRLAPVQEVTTAENTGMLNIIHGGQADYFFISEEEAVELVRTSGLLPEDFKFVRFADMPMGNKRYLMFSRKVDTDIIDRINEAITVQAGRKENSSQP